MHSQTIRFFEASQNWKSTAAPYIIFLVISPQFSRFVDNEEVRVRKAALQNRRNRLFWYRSGFRITSPRDLIGYYQGMQPLSFEPVYIDEIFEGMAVFYQLGARMDSMMDSPSQLCQTWMRSLDPAEDVIEIGYSKSCHPEMSTYKNIGSKLYNTKYIEKANWTPCTAPVP
jgi:hypothetical protein